MPPLTAHAWQHSYLVHLDNGVTCRLAGSDLCRRTGPFTLLQARAMLRQHTYRLPYLHAPLMVDAALVAAHGLRNDMPASHLEAFAAYRKRLAVTEVRG